MAEESPIRAEIHRRKAAEPSPFKQEMARRQSPMELATGVVRAAGSGLTFGFQDEADAALHALIDRNEGEDYLTAYRRHRDGIRQQMAQFQRANPVTAVLSEASGAVVPGMGIAAPAARFIGQAGGKIGTIGRSALIGSGEGAAFGAGSANEISDLPTDMMTGAMLGGAIGGGVSAAGQALGGTSSALQDFFQPGAGANRRIAQAIERDGMKISSVRKRLGLELASGRPATVADAGGQNLKRELETVVQSPGPAAQRAETFLSARNKDQLNRLSRDMVKFTGIKGDDVNQVIERTMKDRAEASVPVYERAFNFNAELNDDIVEAYRRAIKTPLGKEALSKAKRILNAENFDAAPLMDRIDALKRGYDDLIGVSERSGEKQISRRGVIAKNDLIRLVDDVNPAYQQAREIWEGGAVYLKSIDTGREILKPGYTASRMRSEWLKLSDVGREAFKIGAVDAIVTRMRQQSAQEPNLIKILRSPEIRDKVKAMMTPRDGRKFDRLIDFEDSMFATSNQARRGSATARRDAAMGEQDKQARLIASIDMLMDISSLGLRPLFYRGVPAMTAAARKQFLARQNDIIARRLLSSDPAIFEPLKREAARGAGAKRASSIAQSTATTGSIAAAED